MELLAFCKLREYNLKTFVWTEVILEYLKKQGWKITELSLVEMASCSRFIFFLQMEEIVAFIVLMQIGIKYNVLDAQRS